MTATASALVLEGPRRLTRRSLPLPEVTPDTGRLRIEACGLCGTDHEQWSGVLRAPHAFIPGHEVVGVVDEAGDEALARWDVDVGDRVAVEVFASCRDCSACRRGDTPRCRLHGLADMVGFVDVDRDPGLWGGYATHLHLTGDAVLHRVPPGLDPVVATLFNPLGAGIRWGVELPGTGPGDVVAVLGPGVRGLSVAAAVTAAGAGFVMVTGFGPGDVGRLAETRRFGADLTVDVSRDDPVAALRNAVGRRADVVVDVTAKAPTAPGQALDLLRPGGTVVLAGTRGDGATPGFDADRIVYQEARVLGALGVDPVSSAAAVDLLAGGSLPFVDLPRATASFDDLDAMLAAMAGEGGDPPLHGVFVP